MNTTDDFAAALADSEVSVVKLTGDLNPASSFTISGEKTVDLNGHNIMATLGSALFNVNGGKLTLTGDGYISNRSQVAIVKNGEVIVDNGTFNSSSAAVIRAMAQGKVTINGGDLTGREGAVDSRDKGDNDGCNAVITVNGGHLTGTDNFAIATNGSTGMGHNTITINDGVLEGNIKSTGYEAIGVYVANNDTFVMNGGEIIAHGGTGLCMRGGDVTINNGTITATGTDKEGNPVADGKVGDDSTVLTGVSAIVYHKKSNYAGGKEGMSLKITGGTITGIDHSIDVISDEETPNITVTGGTLTPVYPEPVVEQPEEPEQTTP